MPTNGAPRNYGSVPSHAQFSTPKAPLAIQGGQMTQGPPSTASSPPGPPPHGWTGNYGGTARTLRQQQVRAIVPEQHRQAQGQAPPWQQGPPPPKGSVMERAGISTATPRRSSTFCKTSTILGWPSRSTIPQSEQLGPVPVTRPSEDVEHGDGRRRSDRDPGDHHRLHTLLEAAQEAHEELQEPLQLHGFRRRSYVCRSDIGEPPDSGGRSDRLPLVYAP